MKTFTIADIRAMEPCYNPAKYLPETWSGTALDLLNIKKIPSKDRLWVVLRNELLSDKTLRLFAVWCAKQVVTPDTHPNSLNAIDVAKAYAENYSLVDCPDYREAWDLELSAAWSAAESAARSAAWSAARTAARSAAYFAARTAAESAAQTAAESAAQTAAESAAYFAAYYAAESAAQTAQVAQLRKMLVANANKGESK